jgi:hypothetical protein
LAEFAISIHLNHLLFHCLKLFLNAATTDIVRTEHHEKPDEHRFSPVNHHTRPCDGFEHMESMWRAGRVSDGSFL